MRKSRFSEQMSIGTRVPSQSSALRLVLSLNGFILSAKAFDIIISSQPLSTKVLQGKLSVGPPTFPLKTSKACLLESLLTLYGEKCTDFYGGPVELFLFFSSFSFWYFVFFFLFVSFISFSTFFVLFFWFFIFF